MNKENHFYESYLPVRQVIRRWSDRMKKVEEPLFYSYVFVKAELIYRYELLQIPGVTRFVLTEGKPATISPEEIERIRRIESVPGNIQNEPFCSIGDRVRVRQGAFAGMEGLLIRKANSKERFLIQLPLLQQAISVEISVEDLVKLN